MTATTLSDINDTLQEQNGTLSQLSSNIGSFITRINKLESGKRLDDLEADRESKKIGFGTSVSKVFSRTMAAGKGAVGKMSMPSLGFGKLASLGGIAGAAAALGKGLLMRGVPAVALGLLAQEIADYVESETGSKELADAAFRSTKLGAIGLLFGKRFGIIGAAIGAVLTKENQKLLSDIGENARARLKEMGIEIPTMPEMLEGVTTTINGALTGINKALKGEMPSLDEFKNVALALGGLAAILAPGATFRMLLKGLSGLAGTAAKMLGLGFGKAGAAAAAGLAGAVLSPLGLAALIAGSLYFAIKDDQKKNRTETLADKQYQDDPDYPGFKVDVGPEALPYEYQLEKHLKGLENINKPYERMMFRTPQTVLRPPTAQERAAAAGMSRSAAAQLNYTQGRNLPSTVIKELNASSGFAGGGTSVVSMDNSDNSVRNYSSTSNQGLVMNPPTPMDKWDPYFPSR